MEKVIEIFIKVLYNSKDITADITKYLLALTYSDKVEGESDEIVLELEDVEGLWRNGWYPDKGAKLDVTIGYEGNIMRCGVFELDEIEHNGPPDTVTLRGLAAAISGTLRTKRSSAHENKSLRQIAQTIAARNGLTVQGTIGDVRIGRVTQKRETDLAFLRRVASEYGYLFSVRGKTLVFTSIYDLEAVRMATSIDRLDVASYSFRDKTQKTYKDAKVSYHNPDTKQAVVRTEKNADGYAYTQVATGDTKVIHTKAENKQQAELKAKAILHRNNSHQQEGGLATEGNPLLVAGNNFELTGFGVISGIWHITESTHTIDRSSGYGTDLKVKRVKAADKAKHDSVKRKDARVQRAQSPATVSVVNAKVDNRQSRDQVRFVPFSNAITGFNG